MTHYIYFNLRFFLFITLFFSLVNFVNAQTTGKIAGKVQDANSGEGLIAANVLLEGTGRGAATDIDGNFFIINVPPGKYNLIVQMLGYEKLTVKDIVVSVNRTSNFELELRESTLELGEEVIVTAKGITMKKDQTSSIRNVGADQIEALPVENLSDVVNMQAGVVDGHFRGGRSTEVTYLIDGLQIDNSFSKTSRNVNVETEVIQEVEVITGTFNAEYGNAMSGIVNAVTKSGAEKFEGSVSIGASNYLTSNKDVFIGLEDAELRNKDYKLYLSGPIIRGTLSYVFNGRYQDNKNHLNSIHLFNPDDITDFQSLDENFWYSEKNGSGDFVPFNTNENYSVFGKLAFNPITDLRTSLTYTRNYRKLRSIDGVTYSHSWKYNPDGVGYDYRTSNMLAFQLNHSLSNSVFYEFKSSWVETSNDHYLYENPNDERYLSDFYERTDPWFRTGGQDKSWSESKLTDINAKLDFTWQLNQNHILKTGVNFVHHTNDVFSAEIQNKYFADPQSLIPVFDTVRNKFTYPHYEPVILPDSSDFTTRYTAKPFEAAFYIQDKMEYENMVVNFGVRLDYFNPNTKYPSDWRNPDNSIIFSDENIEKRSVLLDAESEYQISPRLGLSYQLGESALLRFAYGHFFQMPPLNNLFRNPTFLVSPFDFRTLMGNPQLKPEKTIQYEVGLWQQLNENMSFEVAVYYRDIYDLLGTRIVTTYNQVRYGLFTNLDYGNVKGMELKYDYIMESLSFFLNYTLQFTRGNANNPDQSFDRAGGNLDPVNKLFPLDWDQRHTLNASLGYSGESYGMTATAYFNSGTRYNWTPIIESPLALVNLDINNSVKPSRFNVDLRGYVDLLKTELFSMRLNILVYNLFDTLLEEDVYETTGRAYEDVVREHQIENWRSDFNTVFDRIQNPGMYAAPREVKISLDLRF